VSQLKEIIVFKAKYSYLADNDNIKNECISADTNIVANISCIAIFYSYYDKYKATIKQHFFGKYVSHIL